jgi:heme exporter protein D
MNWGSPSEFFAMGGYALYVWGAYGMAAAAVVGELVLLARRRRTLVRRLGRSVRFSNGAGDEAPA